MGMGSPRPVALDNKGMSDILTRLVGHSAVQRMAIYQNAAFALWAPRVYNIYEDARNTLKKKLPHLPENFPGVSVFAAAAFNFGGNVWTFKHRDFLNWAFGWCAITVLGKFDPTRSAQLILWELKLVIDFPHAATALIPSAVITHSNTPVAPGDYHTSFTQYTAGAIFHWVSNGCRTEQEVFKQDSGFYRQVQKEKDGAYLERILNFSTIEELCNKIDSE